MCLACKAVYTGSIPVGASDGNPCTGLLEHSQANAPMSMAASRGDDAIRNGGLVHDGDERLRAHVMNTVSEPSWGTPSRWSRTRRPRSSRWRWHSYESRRDSGAPSCVEQYS